jgi:hypothetical protein
VIERFNRPGQTRKMTVIRMGAQAIPLEWSIYKNLDGKQSGQMDILDLYPLVPGFVQPLSKTANPAEIQADQRLLEESLAAHKQENKKQLFAIINEINRFPANAGVSRFTVSGDQVEGLLQVLNDIRVGSWQKLGSPDAAQKKTIELNEQNARYTWVIEVAGLFQMALLTARD